MTAAQPGLFAEGVTHHRYLELTLTSQDPAALRAALHAAKDRQPKRDFAVFFAFSKRLLRALGRNQPDDLVDFPGYAGGGFSAPATQADIWVWIQGASMAGTVMLARDIAASLQPAASLDREHVKLHTEGNRDLMGFVDGTGNPKTLAAREAAALTPKGGSYVVTQTWHHDLDAFAAHSVSEQEAVIGRTKYEDIELEGDAMPKNSHVARTDVDVNGAAMSSLRRSAVIGDSQHQGLYFIAFACALNRHDIQFRRMYGLTDDGITDALLAFSTPVSGSYFYAPGRQELLDILEGQTS